MDYFTTNNLFCIQQFSFRPGHSTELAALKLANHLIAEMDNCKFPTNIYIDMSKVFDTLNFDILLKKLDHYGIDESAKRLMHSYLTDRFQFVEYNRCPWIHCLHLDLLIHLHWGSIRISVRTIVVLNLY